MTIRDRHCVSGHRGELTVIVDEAIGNAPVVDIPPQQRPPTVLFSKPVLDIPSVFDQSSVLDLPPVQDSFVPTGSIINMKSSILVSMALALMPLSMALPTTTQPTSPVRPASYDQAQDTSRGMNLLNIKLTRVFQLNPLLDQRQASCTDFVCRRDTDCYANRCGDCDLNIGKCTCPPEANGGPC